MGREKKGGEGVFFGFVWMIVVRRTRYVAVTGQARPDVFGPLRTLYQVLVAAVRLPRTGHSRMMQHLRGAGGLRHTAETEQYRRREDHRADIYHVLILAGSSTVTV